MKITKKISVLAIFYALFTPMAHAGGPLLSLESSFYVVCVYSVLVSGFLLSLLWKRRKSAHNYGEKEEVREEVEVQGAFLKESNVDGFSLAEVMVAAGMLGLLSLGVAQMMKNQNKTMTYAETKSEELELFNRIRVLMMDKRSCENSLKGIGFGTSVTELKNSNDLAILEVGKKYGNRSVKLEAVTLENISVPPGDGFGQAKLKVSFRRMKKAIPAKLVTKDIMIQVTTVADKVEECYSDIKQTIVTAKEETCGSLDGAYDHATGNCVLDCSQSDNNTALSAVCLQQRIDGDLDDRWVNVTGDTMTGALAINSTLNVSGVVTAQGDVNAQGAVRAVGQVKSDQELCVNGRCRDFNAKNCAPGQMVKKINADGSLVCQGISCASTKYFQGFDASGNPICKALPTKSCPTNQYVSEIKPNGSVVCKNVPYSWGVGCSAGQYIQSINASGTPVCVGDKNVYGKSCTGDQYLQGYAWNGLPICKDLPSSGGDKCKLLVRWVGGLNSSGVGWYQSPVVELNLWETTAALVKVPVKTAHLQYSPGGEGGGSSTVPDCYSDSGAWGGMFCRIEFKVECVP